MGYNISLYLNNERLEKLDKKGHRTIEARRDFINKLLDEALK